MAVYKRRYNPYAGSLTPEWSRFFVLTRYALADLFKARFFIVLLVLSLVPILFFAGYIFIANNKTVQLLMQVRSADLFSVEAQYFVVITMVQTQAAFLLNCRPGQERMDLVALVDDYSNHLVLRDLDFDAFPHFSRSVGLG